MHFQLWFFCFAVLFALLSFEPILLSLFHSIRPLTSTLSLFLAPCSYPPHKSLPAPYPTPSRSPSSPCSCMMRAVLTSNKTPIINKLRPRLKAGVAITRKKRITIDSVPTSAVGGKLPSRSVPNPCAVAKLSNGTVNSSHLPAPVRVPVLTPGSVSASACKRLSPNLKLPSLKIKHPTSRRPAIRSPAAAKPSRRSVVGPKPEDKCGQCGAYSNDNIKGNLKWIGCSFCKIWYHICCVKIPLTDYFCHYFQTKVKWCCPSCSSALTSVLKAKNPPPAAAKQASLTKDANLSCVTVSGLPDDNHLKPEFEALKANLDEQYLSLHSRMELLSQAMESLNEALRDMKKDEQLELKKHSLTISNFPTESLGSISDLPVRLCNAIGLAPSFAGNIDSIFTFRRNNGPTYGQVLKSRLCIRFNTLANRASFFKAYIRSLRSTPLTLDKLVPGCYSARVFINEDLDHNENELFKAALLLKKRGKISKIMVLDRKVFIVKFHIGSQGLSIRERLSRNLISILNKEPASAELPSNEPSASCL